MMEDTAAIFVADCCVIKRTWGGTLEYIQERNLITVLFVNTNVTRKVLYKRTLNVYTKMCLTVVHPSTSEKKTVVLYIFYACTNFAQKTRGLLCCKLKWNSLFIVVQNLFKQIGIISHEVFLQWRRLCIPHASTCTNAELFL